HAASRTSSAAPFWCGKMVGPDIVLRKISSTGAGTDDQQRVRVPFKSLVDPSGSLAYRAVPLVDTEPVTHILLEPDWGTSGLWMMHPGEPGDVDPTDLPISDELAVRMSAWTEVMEDLRHVSDYPPEWMFASADDERSWVDDGASIATDLQHELGHRYQVHYRIWGKDQPFATRFRTP